MSSLPNVVLVHGAWADGSSWSAVIERLQADGYHVTAPQFPMTTLADNVARLRQVLAAQDGPTIVAGHSYGGQIITALGTDAPNVAGLSTSPPSGSTRASHWARCCPRGR
jgi:pimeloyl-ACP methyl ester carboxylesterase